MGAKRTVAKALDGFSRMFATPSNLLVGGQLASPSPHYFQDDFYLAELEARRDMADRKLVGPEIGDYVREVQAMRWDRYAGRASWPVTIIISNTAAPYYHSSKIIVPSPVRELIVLHEIAHHFVGPGAIHGPLFVQAFLDLVAGVRNPAQADEFRVVFKAHGVKW